MNKQMTECCDSTQACRMMGKQMLKTVIDRLNQKAKSLQIIYDMLPEKPTPEQDEAIWQTSLEIEI